MLSIDFGVLAIVARDHTKLPQTAVRRLVHPDAPLVHQQTPLTAQALARQTGRASTT